MSDYETEEQQVEALKQWWKENGKSVLLGVILGVAGIFSWRGWISYQNSQAVTASEIFTKITEAMVSGDSEAVNTMAAGLREDHSASAFAAMASLLDAKSLVEENQLDAAADVLQWVADYAGLEEMKIVARIRKARVLLASGDPDGALEVLPESPPLAFSAMVAEVNGDIYLAKGEVGKARESYQKAQASGNASADPNLLGMKLDDLAVEETVDSNMDKDES